MAHVEGFSVSALEKAEERGGTVAVNVPHAWKVSRELLARDLIVDYRPGAGIRIPRHSYASDDELEAVIREMRSILESKAYEKHLGKRAYVT